MRLLAFEVTIQSTIWLPENEVTDDGVPEGKAVAAAVKDLCEALGPSVLSDRVTRTERLPADDLEEDDNAG